MNGPSRHVSDYDGDLAAAGLHVCICSHDVNSVRVWGLSHDVQSVIRHHSLLYGCARQLTQRVVLHTCW